MLLDLPLQGRLAAAADAAKTQTTPAQDKSEFSREPFSHDMSTTSPSIHQFGGMLPHLSPRLATAAAFSFLISHSIAASPDAACY